MAGETNIYGKFICVVCEEKDGSQFVEAVPYNRFKDNYVYWPKSKKNQKKQCQLDFPANFSDTNEWEKCRMLSLKGVYDYYEAASGAAKKLSQFEDTDEETRSITNLSRTRQQYHSQEKASTNAYESIMSAQSQHQPTSHQAQPSTSNFQPAQLPTSNFQPLQPFVSLTPLPSISSLPLQTQSLTSAQNKSSNNGNPVQIIGQEIFIPIENSFEIDNSVNFAPITEANNAVDLPNEEELVQFLNSNSKDGNCMLFMIS